MDEQSVWATLNKRIDRDGPTGCWLWKGRTRYGYGQIELGRRDGKRNVWLAHRLTYFLTHGSKPPQLHHACHVRACVNPDHLVPTTPSEHLQTHHRHETCKFGHDWSDPENVYVRENGDRYCQACARDRARSRSRNTYRSMSIEERQQANRERSERRRLAKARAKADAE